MSDTEIIDALEAMPALVLLARAGEPFGNQWMFYDRRNAPEHKGWTKCKDLRAAVRGLVASLRQG